jgi:hypothetical protein
MLLYTEKQIHQLNMKTIVFIIWKIRSFMAAIIRSAKKTAVRIMVRREVTDCMAGTAGRQAVLTGRRYPYVGHRLPFLKYAPYTARDGIRQWFPNWKAGATENSDFPVFN